MFGKNEIHGRKTFEGHEDLLVTSIFYTLQGEGPFAGRPAVFLRLAHCNLACSFCDTNFSYGDWMSHAVVVERLLAACTGKINVEDCVLIITGGEPSLQSNALQMLLTLTSAYFNKVQIESNGLLAMNLPNSTYLVVSPKCTEGLIPFAHYLKPHKDTLHRANCLKFVITADDTSPYYTVPDWAFKWRDKRGSQRPIYVSPMAEYKRPPDLTHLSSGNLEQRSVAERVSFWESGLLDKDKVRANHEYAARYCLEHGFYLTMQMQLFTSLA